MRFYSALAPLGLLLGATAFGAEVPRVQSDPIADVSFESPCVSDEQFFRALKDKHEVSREQVPFTRLVIAGDGARFELELMATDGSSRSLFDTSCQTLADTALVIVASQVHAAHSPPATQPVAPVEPSSMNEDPPTVPADPEFSTQSQVEPESSAPLLLAETPKAISDEGTRERKPTANREKTEGRAAIRLAPFAALGAGVSFALHPSPAFFVELGGGLRSGKWGSTLLFRYHFPTENLTTDTVGLRLVSASARAALAYFPIPALALEVGPSLSWLSGSGVGVSRPENSVVWLVSAEIDASVIPLRAKSWALGAGVRGFVSLNSPRFELEDQSPVYSIPRVGAGVFFHGFWSGR